MNAATGTSVSPETIWNANTGVASSASKANRPARIPQSRSSRTSQTRAPSRSIEKKRLRIRPEESSTPIPPQSQPWST
jgi:hypothetical protein